MGTQGAHLHSATFSYGIMGGDRLPALPETRPERYLCPQALRGAPDKATFLFAVAHQIEVFGQQLYLSEDISAGADV